MTCPKCQGTMQTFERGGVQIDQCLECRGVYLDRGELEQILDAEQRFYEAAPPTYRGDSPPPYRGGQRYPRRRSFLSELFD